MTVRVNVAGGTGAGVRMVRTLESWTHECAAILKKHPAADPLEIDCDVTLSGERYSCPMCGARRP